jgi:hypothetical protein
MRDDGGFIVVWGGYTNGSDYNVFGRLYNSAGSSVGSEFRVNDYTSNWQNEPSVAMDGSGNFVVVWASPQDGSGLGILGRRYSSSGMALTGEFPVNTLTASSQSVPRVGMNRNGSFVVAWESYESGSRVNIFARRYNSSGAPIGAEFRVNTVTADYQVNSSVALDPAANFVVTWQSYSLAANYDVAARRYNSSGAALGGQFQVNPATPDFQGRPSVAMDPSGGFWIAWHDVLQSGGFSSEVYARRYNSSGAALSSEFTINTYTTNSQSDASIASDGLGNMVVVWKGFKNGSNDIFGKRFTSSGSAVDAQDFQVNTYTTDSQEKPDVVMSQSGAFFVVWNSNGQDGSGFGVFGQRYYGPPSTFTPTRTPTRTHTPTATRTVTATSTRTPTVTVTRTPTSTHTATLTGTATSTSTRTPTRTVTPTWTATRTATQTATRTVTPTPTLTPEAIILQIVPPVGMDEITLSWTQSVHLQFLAYELWRWSGLTIGDTDRWRSPWPWLAVFAVFLAVGLGRRPGSRRRSLSAALAAASLGGLILSTHSSSAKDEPGAARVGMDAQRRGLPSPSLPPTAELVLRTTNRFKLGYIDKPLQPGIPYSYQLFVLTSEGISSASNVAEAETLPLPTATPTLTPTATVTRTPTPTSTITPCPTSERTISTSGLGVGANASQATRTWVIGDLVLQSQPITLTVGGLLCWQPESCGTLDGVRVGPEGAPCPQDNSDCFLDPFPIDNHARFYYQINNGQPQFVPRAGTFSVALLEQGDRVFLDINDHHYENNSGGFSVELRYTYSNCTAGP